MAGQAGGAAGWFEKYKSSMCLGGIYGSYMGHTTVIRIATDVEGASL